MANTWRAGPDEIVAPAGVFDGIGASGNVPRVHRQRMPSRTQSEGRALAGLPRPHNHLRVLGKGAGADDSDAADPDHSREISVCAEEHYSTTTNTRSASGTKPGNKRTLDLHVGFMRLLDGPRRMFHFMASRQLSPGMRMQPPPCWDQCEHPVPVT